MRILIQGGFADSDVQRQLGAGHGMSKAVGVMPDDPDLPSADNYRAAEEETMYS